MRRAAPGHDPGTPLLYFKKGHYAISDFEDVLMEECLHHKADSVLRSKQVALHHVLMKPGNGRDGSWSSGKVVPIGIDA